MTNAHITRLEKELDYETKESQVLAMVREGLDLLTNGNADRVKKLEGLIREVRTSIDTKESNI